MNGTVNLIETSMSEFSSFERCRKQYHYLNILGWQPRTVPTSWQIGTLFHACMAAGFAAVRAQWDRCGGNAPVATEVFLPAATNAAYQIERDRNGLPLHLDQGDRELVEDMIRFSWANEIIYQVDTWDAILAVEEPAYIQIDNYLIRNTFDLVVQVGGQQVVIDFKTVDDPRDSKEWLRMDFQTRVYCLAARGKWGSAQMFRHVFVARDVPPGFGHRPITTETGKPRKKADLERMQDPKRYFQVTETTLDDRQLDATLTKLIALVRAADAQRCGEQPYTETRIKAGPFACGNCAFFEACISEMDGNPIEAGFTDLTYIRKGSPEWLTLNAPTPTP